MFLCSLVLAEFVNRELRRIFGLKRYEARGNWRHFHNEEFNNLYSSPNIIMDITSRRRKWDGRHEKFMQNFSKNNLK
jgi:hypothetical protein